MTDNYSEKKVLLKIGCSESIARLLSSTNDEDFALGLELASQYPYYKIAKAYVTANTSLDIPKPLLTDLDEFWDPEGIKIWNENMVLFETAISF